MYKNTTLCYLEQDGCWLMMHRIKKKNDANQDKWVGVGGKFEKGESPEECLTREVYEETGLNLTDYRFRGVVTFVSDQWETEYMHLFSATGWTGEMIDGDACVEGKLEWVPKADVYDLPIWQGDKIFLHLLETRPEFFSLKLVYHGEELVQAVLDGKAIEI